MLIILSPDEHTPFTADGTDVYTDATIRMHFPDLAGWYLVDAQLQARNESEAGDVTLEVYDFDQDAWLIVDGVSAGVLTLPENDRIGTLASDDGSLTTLQLGAENNVGLICTSAGDGFGRGLKVWLKWGNQPAAGANDPVFD